MERKPQAKRRKCLWTLPEGQSFNLRKTEMRSHTQDTTHSNRIGDRRSNVWHWKENRTISATTQRNRYALWISQKAAMDQHKL
jgi:hypothetical protein